MNYNINKVIVCCFSAEGAVQCCNNSNNPYFCFVVCLINLSFAQVKLILTYIHLKPQRQVVMVPMMAYNS